MNAIKTIKLLQEAWQAKDFEQARPLLVNTCENMIALENFELQVLSRPEAAMGILTLFEETGLHEAPEGSAMNLIFKRVKETALKGMPSPEETIH